MDWWHEMLAQEPSMALLWLAAMDVLAVSVGFVIVDFCKPRLLRRSL
jgi:hypothetical protein